MGPKYGLFSRSAKRRPRPRLSTLSPCSSPYGAIGFPPNMEQASPHAGLRGCDDEFYVSSVRSQHPGIWPNTSPDITGKVFFKPCHRLDQQTLSEADCRREHGRASSKEPKTLGKAGVPRGRRNPTVRSPSDEPHRPLPGSAACGSAPAITGASLLK